MTLLAPVLDFGAFRLDLGRVPSDMLNALAFGAKPDGTDVSAQLQAFLDAIPERGTGYIPPGCYYIGSSGLKFAKNFATLLAWGVQFEYNGTGIALDLTAAGDARYDGLSVVGLSLWCKRSSWDGSTGIRLTNCNKGTFQDVSCFFFTTGIQMRGVGEGCVYNHLMLRSMVDNKVGILIKPEGTGWVNENLFMGGSFSMSSGKPDYTGTYHVYMDFAGVGNRPNSNTFLKCSFESAGSNAVIPIYDQGAHDTVVGCRFEGVGAITLGAHSYYFNGMGNYGGTISGNRTYVWLDAANGSVISGMSGAALAALKVIANGSATHPAIGVASPNDPATLVGYMTTSGTLKGTQLDLTYAPAVLSSSASDVNGLKTDLNNVIQKLKDIGVFN